MVRAENVSSADFGVRGTNRNPSEPKPTCPCPEKSTDHESPVSGTFCAGVKSTFGIVLQPSVSNETERTNFVIVQFLNSSHDFEKIDDDLFRFRFTDRRET